MAAMVRFVDRVGGTLLRQRGVWSSSHLRCCRSSNSLLLQKGAFNKYQATILFQQPINSNRAFSSSNSDEIIPGVGIGKTSTGIVGLAVEPDWYNIMLKRFQALLDKMEASDMPVTAQYRIDVTKWCNFVIKNAKANPTDPEAVEDAVNMGQVEELIEMAEDEMICMEMYLRTRMWEMVEEMNPQIDFHPDPMADPMAPGGDPDVQAAFRDGNAPRK